MNKDKHYCEYRTGFYSACKSIVVVEAPVSTLSIPERSLSSGANPMLDSPPSRSNSELGIIIGGGQRSLELLTARAKSEP